MTQLDFPDDPDEFADNLIAAGMPTERAHVYARYALGESNKDIVDALDKSKSGVSTHYDEALGDISEARKLVHYTSKPLYLNELPHGAGKRLDEEIEHTVAFRLNRPRPTSSAVDAEFTLEDADSLEGFWVEEDSYLLKYQSLAGGRRGTTRYFVLESQFLVRFIHDWVVPNRLKPLRDAVRDGDFADRWFLMDAFEPEWLEDELAQVGIERVEALTDDRFVNPLEEHVSVADAALTGWSHEGYKVAYSPTEREVGELLCAGELTAEDAERITRMPPEHLREAVQ